MKKFGIITGLVVLVLAISVFSFFYFGTYSSGVRSGVVIKVSEKGYIFKTYEGQMTIMSFGAIKDANTLTNTFEFSIDGKKTDVVNALKDVSLTGERVNVEYVERYTKFFWEGETKYFVTGVQRLKQIEPPKQP